MPTQIKKRKKIKVRFGVLNSNRTFQLLCNNNNNNNKLSLQFSNFVDENKWSIFNQQCKLSRRGKMRDATKLDSWTKNNYR